MRQLAVFLFILTTSQLANAVTIKELAGSYKISHEEIPVVNIVKIGSDGNVSLTEMSPAGKLECSGKGKLSKNLFKSSVTCTDGQQFSQRINLNGVKNFTKFKAMVFSSLYGQELEMNFEKL